MTDTTSPVQSTSLNGTANGSVLGSIWDGVSSFFTNSLDSMENYWTASTLASQNVLAAQTTALRQGVNLTAPPSTLSTNTVVMLALGAAVLLVVLKK